MDGAMAFQVLGELESFKNPQTPWIASLASHPNMRLAGPLLIADTQVAEGSAPALEIAQAQQAFAQNLHWSRLQSNLNLKALAAHLQRFTSFRDQTGGVYGLRLADCRVLNYLPQILGPEQWNALTSPITHWQAHNRKGEAIIFPFNKKHLESPLSKSVVPGVFQLDEEQIEALIQAGEPDSLLANLDMEPEKTDPQRLQWNYDIAQRCVKAWQQYAIHHSKQCDRRVLQAFAQRVFSSNAVWLSKRERVMQELQDIFAALQWD
nr:DUF4123 domain-containing protein [Comamonas composti]